MIVVDTSAVVDALTGLVGSDELRKALIEDELHAPDLVDYEVVAALRGLNKGGKLSDARAMDALTDFSDLFIQRWPFGNELRRRAFEMRANLSVYDAAYVVLAEALNCPLLTRDHRLKRAAGDLIRIEVR